MKSIKQKLILTLSLGFLITAGIVSNTSQTAYAAHPVETTAAATSSSSYHETANASAKEVSTADMTNQANTQQSSQSDKSQLVALLLCFFLGGLGIHRFYLGYTWQGVVQLLTGGGCGVWTLIDFIRICMGNLGPKGGSYDKTL